jgi:hypothetical protein
MSRGGAVRLNIMTLGRVRCQRLAFLPRRRARGRHQREESFLLFLAALRLVVE